MAFHMLIEIKNLFEINKKISATGELVPVKDIIL